MRKKWRREERESARGKKREEEKRCRGMKNWDGDGGVTHDSDGHWERSDEGIAVRIGEVRSTDRLL